MRKLFCKRKLKLKGKDEGNKNCTYNSSVDFLKSIKEENAKN